MTPHAYSGANLRGIGSRDRSRGVDVVLLPLQLLM